MEIGIEFLNGYLLIFIFIFKLYILEFTNPNFIRFNLTNYLFILGTFDDGNNISKKEPIGEATMSVKIR